jgi:hypothetical protein
MDTRDRAIRLSPRREHARDAAATAARRASIPLSGPPSFGPARSLVLAVMRVLMGEDGADGESQAVYA